MAAVMLSISRSTVVCNCMKWGASQLADVCRIHSSLVPARGGSKSCQGGRIYIHLQAGTRELCILQQIATEQRFDHKGLCQVQNRFVPDKDLCGRDVVQYKLMCYSTSPLPFIAVAVSLYHKE